MAPKRARVTNDPVTNIANKRIEVTKFVSTPILAKLGLEEVTREMFAKAGLGDFIDKSAMTHPNLTKEFLSTLAVEYVEQRIVRRITFKYCKKVYAATYDQMREAFGVTKDAQADESVNQDSLIEWWESVTNVWFDDKNETDSKVNFPPWRIIHKIVSMCFAGKSEANKISQKQLFMMYPFSFESNYYPCWVSKFVKACMDCRLLRSGDIAMGGMITLVALSAGVPVKLLERDPPLPGSFSYDEAWWYAHGWLKGRDPVEGQWMYRYGPGWKYGVLYPRRELVRLGPVSDMWIEPDKEPNVAMEGMAPRRHDATASGSGTHPMETSEPGGSDWADWRNQTQSDIVDISERLGRIEVNQQSVLDWTVRFDQRFDSHLADQLVWQQRQATYQEQQAAFQAAENARWEQQAREWMYARSHYYHPPPPPDMDQ